MRRTLPPSRSRRIAKWTGLAVCVVIVALWAVSTRVTLGYLGRNILFGILRGGTRVALYDQTWFDEVEWGWYAESYSGFTLGDAIGLRHMRGQGFVSVSIPLWVPFLFLAIPTAILWHRDRRTLKPGCCRTCGYDLRASKKVCPECGTATAPPGITKPSV